MQAGFHSLRQLIYSDNTDFLLKVNRLIFLMLIVCVTPRIPHALPPSHTIINCGTSTYPEGGDTDSACFLIRLCGYRKIRSEHNNTTTKPQHQKRFCSKTTTVDTTQYKTQSYHWIRPRSHWRPFSTWLVLPRNVLQCRWLLHRP
jgi:hypothetical protein